MAPPRRFRSPLEQLPELLRDARAKGMPFDEAWERTVRPGKPPLLTNASPKVMPDAIRWPTDRPDRLAWQAAIIETCDTWRRAYERDQPTTSDMAVSHLGAALDVLWGIADLADVA